MSVTVHFGWWLLPATVTVAVVAIWLRYYVSRKSGVDYDFGTDLLLVFMAAMIVSLLSRAIGFGLRLLSIQS